MRILFVEPDAILAQTYRSYFAQIGHQVDVAASAQAAVHVADQRLPDVVVVELQMAGHNGVEFLYEFRSYTEWLRVPVIIHTFVPPAELASSPTLEGELGVSRILHKPTTSLSQLHAAVQRAVPVPS